MLRIPVRNAVWGLLLTTALWLAMAAFAEWHGASWPHRQVNVVTCFDRVTLEVDYAKCKWLSAQFQWQNFLFLGIIIEFLWLKSWLMARMSTRFDRLGVSLILGNVALSVLSLYGMAISLFPSWASSLTPLITIRAIVAIVLLFSILQLLLVRDLESTNA